jgi:hypothetical protein
MKAKKIVVLALVLTLLCGFFSVDAYAAPASTGYVEGTTLDAEVWVKQTRMLTVFYNYKVVPGKDVTWKVTEGSKYVKVNKQGAMTGKKAGKAVIKATYKGYTFTFNITVSKAPKAKAKTYKINGASIKLPKGYVRNEALEETGEDADKSKVFSYVKDDTILYIGTDTLPSGTDVNSLPKEKLEVLRGMLIPYIKSVCEQHISIAETQVATLGFTVEKSGIEYEKELNLGYKALYSINTTSGNNIYIYVYFTMVKDRIITFTLESDSKERIESLSKAIIDKNGYEK